MNQLYIYLLAKTIKYVSEQYQVFVEFLDIFPYFYYCKIYVKESKYNTGSEECQLILTPLYSLKNLLLVLKVRFN